MMPLRQDKADDFEIEATDHTNAAPRMGPYQPCCADTLGMPVPCQHPPLREALTERLAVRAGGRP